VSRPRRTFTAAELGVLRLILAPESILGLKRATVVADVNASDEIAAAEAWFSRWRSHLSYCSEDKGCGCCVAMWDVEGPEAAIEDLPPLVSAASDWSESAPC